jgi:very-short-patch-repair endonuclease
MRLGSDGERSLLTQLGYVGLPAPNVEYPFAKSVGRGWRFDMAWPDRLVAVEIEGATWAAGRHSRGDGFEEDCVKYAEAAILGWRVLRFTTDMVTDGRAVEMLERALRT